jgi:hypothetical protein
MFFLIKSVAVVTAVEADPLDPKFIDFHAQARLLAVVSLARC